jgi:hypothetical protein
MGRPAGRQARLPGRLDHPANRKAATAHSPNRKVELRTTFGPRQPTVITFDPPTPIVPERCLPHISDYAPRLHPTPPQLHPQHNSIYHSPNPATTPSTLKNKVECSVHCHATEFDCRSLCNLETRTEIALVDCGRDGTQQPTQRAGDAISEEPAPSDIERPATSPAKSGVPAPASALSCPRKRQLSTIAKKSGKQVAEKLVGGEETVGRVIRPRKRVKGN